MDNSISFPVIRIGKVVKANKNLTEFQSKQVADEIDSKSSEFIGLLTNCYKESGAVYKQLDKGVWWENKETPIINFPAFELYYKDYTCITRSSLTICCKERRSKIWVRASLRKIGNNDSNNLSLSTAKSFFSHLKELINCLIDTTYSNYLNLITEMKLADQMFEKYRFKLYGMNSNNINLENLVRKFSTRRFNRIEDALRNDEYINSIKPLFMNYRHGITNNREDLLSYTRQDNKYYHYLEGNLPNRDYRSFSVTHAYTNHSLINCLCFHDNKSFPRRTPADNATAYILNKYAQTL